MSTWFGTLWFGMMNRSGSEVTGEAALVYAHIIEGIVVILIGIFLLLAPSQTACEIIAGNIWKHIIWSSNSVSDSSSQPSLQSSYSTLKTYGYTCSLHNAGSVVVLNFCLQSWSHWSETLSLKGKGCRYSIFLLFSIKIPKNQRPSRPLYTWSPFFGLWLSHLFWVQTNTDKVIFLN